MLSQYVNLYFPVCSMLTTFILCIVYFGKKKIENLDTSIYKVLLIAGMVESFVMFMTNLLVCFFFIPENYIIFELLNKILYGIYIVWLTILFFYIYKLGNNRNEKIMIGICSIFNIILITMIFISPIELYYKNGLTNSSGVSSTYLYIGCSIYLLMMLIISAIDIKKMQYKRKYVPLFLLLILMTFMLIIRQFDPLFNISSNVLSLVTLVMYFTIENPDLKMVNELEIAKLQAEKSNQAKSDFLSSMSHEIRTPLNAIVGLTDVIKNSDDLNEIHEDAIDISNASENLLEIVNGILDISKIETEKMELVESEYDLMELLNNTEKMINNRLMSKNKDIILQCDFDENIPSKLIGDKFKIQQIMINLLTNAVKYTEHGSINFKVKCTSTNDICKLTIQVKDTGRGIKQEQMNNLFTKFNRLESDMNTDIEGTGLGLAITKGLVDLMNGKIKVESEFEKGSIFTVLISQKICNDIEEVNNENQDTLPENKKILIVDDNKLNIKVAKKILSDMNIQSEGVESGYECVDKLKNGNKYDLILMDIMMPKMSGVETLNKLKEISNFNIPVVAFTADAMEGQENKYLNDGFDGYITKPVNKERLTKLLNNLFGGNQLNEKETGKQVESNEKSHQVLPITDEEIAALNKLIEQKAENKEDK